MPYTHNDARGGREPMIVCEERSDEGLRLFKDGCVGTLRTIDCCGDKRVIEPIIVASRGRNTENPSDRTPGNHVEQRLEPNSEGICNILTSVQKDNYLLEPTVKIKQATTYGYIECELGGGGRPEFP